WVFLLGGGAISWASKTQTCITDSTMEAEFVALAAAGKEAECASTLAKRAYYPIYNGKSKHLGVRHSARIKGLPIWYDGGGMWLAKEEQTRWYYLSDVNYVKNVEGEWFCVNPTWNCRSHVSQVETFDE
ncbi:hypothetical protein Tco_0703286, partial [Tanacetum coccineum]